MQAVRFGRLDVFNDVVSKFEATFRRDANFNLVQRLRQTVLKIGARFSREPFFACALMPLLLCLFLMVSRCSG